MPHRAAPALAVILTFVLALPADAQIQSDLIAPETATGMQATPLVRAQRSMVVSANPLATEAGLAVLEKGGSAADAAIAVQAALGLVEPQSSGLGGGAFALWYDAASATLTTYDARETAPLAATADLFLDDNGEPLPFFAEVLASEIRQSGAGARIEVGARLLRETRRADHERCCGGQRRASIAGLETFRVNGCSPGKVRRADAR